jgi:hypothetical protein
MPNLASTSVLDASVLDASETDASEMTEFRLRADLSGRLQVVEARFSVISERAGVVADGAEGAGSFTRC